MKPLVAVDISGKTAVTVNAAYLYADDAVNIVNADMSVGAALALRDARPGQRIYAHGKIYDIHSGENAGLIYLLDTGIVAAQVAEMYIRHPALLWNQVVGEAHFRTTPQAYRQQFRVR